MLEQSKSITSTNEYGLRPVSRKSGEELFQENGASVEMKLLNFWQWSSSDLLSNTLRGRLAEFIVASALGVASGTRIEWDAVDVVSPSGVKVEVKSSAYLQSWKAKASRISFNVQPKLAWNWDTNSFAVAPARVADVYVFCLHDHQDPKTVEPMNLNQWRFFVLATEELDAKLERQKTIGLAILKTLNAREVNYANLAAAIESAVTR